MVNGRRFEAKKPPDHCQAVRMSLRVSVSWVRDPVVVCHLVWHEVVS